MIDERLKLLMDRCETQIAWWLYMLDKDTTKEHQTADELFVTLYSAAIVSYICGYNPDATLADAKVSAEKILKLIAEEEAAAGVDKP